jgi:hypothetical protein
MKTATNSKELQAIFDEFMKFSEDDFKIILKKIAMDVFKMLVDKTARDTSFLASEWAVVISSEPVRESLEGSSSKTYRPAT